MGCWYRPQTNQLWSVWYCFFILALQGYLLYLGITKYSLYAGSGAQWKSSHGNPEYYLVAYISLHGLVIGLVPFFIGSAVFKIGNLASDGEKLGARGQQVIHVTGSVVCRKLKSAWQHGPPVAQTIHLIMAFALLIANVLMEGQLFKHNILHKEEDFWSSELDFIFNVHGRMSDLVPASNATSIANNANVGPKLLPILMSIKLFGISLEFFNYLLALLIFAAVYPSAFWRANKPFGFLFSCHLIIHALAAVFSYIGFRIMYRIHNFGLFDYSNIHLGGRNSPPFLLNEYLLPALYIGTAGLLFFASAVVYGYGYNKFCLCLIVKRNHSRLRMGKTYYVCCEGYSPHISAIIMLILMVACKSPLLYDQMVLYQQQMKPVLLACIISDVTYLFAWILLWLALTLVRDWKFKTRYTVSELGHLEGVRTSDGKPLADNSLFLMCGEEMYATDEETKKAALLRLAEKCGMGQHDDEVYWLRPHQDGEIAKKNHEMNHLLPVRDQSPQDSTRNGGGSQYKKAGYYKVSFDEMEPPPVVAPTAVVRYPPQRMASAGTTTSGSYVRFNEENGYDHDQDVVTTFGTLPRAEYKQRLGGIQDREFYQPRSQQQQPVGVGGPPSDAGSITYASIHKRGSPNRGMRSDYARLPPVAAAPQPTVTDDAQSVVSRGSSYANIPNHRHQHSWDTGSLGRMADNRPPTGRPPHAPSPYIAQQNDRNASYSSIQNPAQQLYQTNGTPNSVRHRTHYTPDTTVIPVQTRQSPKHSPSQERIIVPQQLVDSSSSSSSTYNRNGVAAMKLSSFAETPEATSINHHHHNHQPQMALETQIPIQQPTSGSSGGTGSSREVTPQSNASGSLSRPKQHQQQQQQQHNVNWRANPIYGHSSVAQTPSSYSATPTSPNSLEVPPNRITNTTTSTTNGNGNANGSNTLSNKIHANNVNLNLDHRDRNDSANFSLTSSNESDNQFVTSMV